MYHDILNLKVNQEEFKLACSDGEVYGEVVEATHLSYVYARLGKEGIYRPRLRDDKNTKYRLFLNCTAFFTDIEDNLDKRIFLAEVPGIKIIIYC